MNHNTWSNWRKWGNFGLAPIPTRQLGSALFVICGHLFIALTFMLGLVQARPERISSSAAKTMQFHLKPPPLIVPGPGQTPTQWVAPTPVPGPTPVSVPETASPPKPIPESAANATSATATTADAAAATTSAPDARAPANLNEDVPYYYPVRQLHQKPQVIEDIATDFTLILPGIETQNVILRLFINDRGSIDHIDIEQTSLPPEVVAVVRAVFSKLRFMAGKIDGMAVKSQIKIEVLLENQQAESINGNQN